MRTVNDYIPVIGLEVHVELKTLSKMFCACNADYFGKPPNTQVCPVCLGLPGALPVPNKTAVDWCILLALALNCRINEFSKFDRKNYFYPDLPKGYQISQYDAPFGFQGKLQIGDKMINIRRVHLEEDTGKLIHTVKNEEKITLIDFNRSGVPLIEIVTEPDFDSPEQVVLYLKKLQRIVRYLGISDADMEKGQMRLEPNISLRRQDTKNLPNYKVEIKNINSFRFVEKAINFEIKRQMDILRNKKTPIQETRGWDEDKEATLPQRTKEEAQDYRYFPEPDIPPIGLCESDIKRIRRRLPELPDEKLVRFQRQYGLAGNTVELLTRDLAIAEFYEEAVKLAKKFGITPIEIANFIINRKIDFDTITPAVLVKQINKAKEKITISQETLSDILEKVFAQNPKAVLDYKSGKKEAIGFLLGAAKKYLPQNLDINQVKAEIIQKLEKLKSPY